MKYFLHCVHLGKKYSMHKYCILKEIILKFLLDRNYKNKYRFFCAKTIPILKPSSTSNDLCLQKQQQICVWITNLNYQYIYVLNK